jgi:hypothetical protein
MRLLLLDEYEEVILRAKKAGIKGVEEWRENFSMVKQELDDAEKKYHAVGEALKKLCDHKDYWDVYEEELGGERLAEELRARLDALSRRRGE